MVAVIFPREPQLASLWPSYGGDRREEENPDHPVPSPRMPASGPTLRLTRTTPDDQRTHARLKWAAALTAFQETKPKVSHLLILLRNRD